MSASETASGKPRSPANGTPRNRYSSASSYPTHTHEARYKALPQSGRRLEEFIGGYYRNYNLSSLLDVHRHDGRPHIHLELWSAPARTKPSFKHARAQAYAPVWKGMILGPSWSNHWFKVTLNIPPEYSHCESVVFEFDAEGEALVFDVEGRPLQGLTGGTHKDRRVGFNIPADDVAAGNVSYYIEASCNGGYGVDDNMFSEQPPRTRWELKTADLVVPNMEAHRLLYDFEFIHDLSRELPRDTTLAQRALYTANQMMNAFIRGDLDSVCEARNAAEQVLGSQWERRVEEQCRGGKQEGRASDISLWAIGHCHIDTAWLWPYSVTQQKAGRSWSAQLDLLDRYPEFIFTATQPQQFQWVEELYPDLWARILDRVKQGRFQPLGCTWVEMDTNIPSGESLVRQFLYGQRYFQRKFGTKSQTFVLPDTFGYSSQLPQLARLAGAPNFFTQKLSWNDVNTFPHSTFNWVGLDGSQVLTHMTPVDAYNAQCKVRELRLGMTGKNADVSAHALLLFGHGDGGGGPTAPMLESLRRTRALESRADAGGVMPRIRTGSFEDFFDAIRDDSGNGALLPTWHGELYLELHRATYTSGGAIKKSNRLSENLLREAEYAATMASLRDPAYKYPKAHLDAVWEDVMLNQFHDVLPGTCITEVYVDTAEIYARVKRDLEEIISEAYDVLYGRAGAGPLIINTLPGFVRTEVVHVSKGTPKGDQATLNDGEYVLARMDGRRDAADLADYTGTPVSVEEISPGVFVMSNAFVTVTISNGRITSFVDIALDRELLAEGSSAGLVMYQDMPNFWDAWDVDAHHLDQVQHLAFDTVAVHEARPLRGSLIAKLRHGNSSFEVTISLDAVPVVPSADARTMLRFDTRVDWHQQHEFVKFELPLAIRSETATYDTQFGIVRRPTHRNTSWDAARFEVCAHRFADVSEWGYGVALLSDCKYGYAVTGNVMTLSLLRGSRMPDPTLDVGTHEFSFAVYPHAKSFGESDVPAVAAVFNNPVRLRTCGGLGLGAGGFTGIPFSVTCAPNVVLETIKRGEDDVASGATTTIVRLYEHQGGTARATVSIAGLHVTRAEVVNILEEHVSELTLRRDNGMVAVRVSLRAFEIKTVRLTLA